jgi:surface protein
VVRWKDGDTYYFSTQRAGVKTTAPEDFSHWFGGLKNLTSLDATMLDTSSVRNMDGLFVNCSSLVDIVGLEDWDVSHVKSMDAMFESCESLQNVDFVAKWDVSKVKNMNWLFWCCPSLQNLNGLRNWNLQR